MFGSVLERTTLREEGPREAGRCEQLHVVRQHEVTLDGHQIVGAYLAQQLRLGADMAKQQVDPNNVQGSTIKRNEYHGPCLT